MELKAKADAVVAELAVCQRENGGRWVAAIPEKYLYWIAEGKQSACLSARPCPPEAGQKAVSCSSAAQAPCISRPVSRHKAHTKHCTVYNMMRLAEFLFRHTGEPEYLQYMEYNRYNGIIQHISSMP